MGHQTAGNFRCAYAGCIDEQCGIVDRSAQLLFVFQIVEHHLAGGVVLKTLDQLLGTSEEFIFPIEDINLGYAIERCLGNERRILLRLLP